jgi:hypothetical protein
MLMARGTSWLSCRLSYRKQKLKFSFAFILIAGVASVYLTMRVRGPTSCLFSANFCFLKNYNTHALADGINRISHLGFLMCSEYSFMFVLISNFLVVCIGARCLILSRALGMASPHYITL